MHFEKFLTFWGYAIHMVYFAGINIPCPALLSLIIWIGSIIHNVFINQTYDLTIDIFIHHLPFATYAALVLFDVLNIRADVFSHHAILLAMSIIFIYIQVNGGLAKVWDIYKDHEATFIGKPMTNL